MCRWSKLCHHNRKGDDDICISCLLFCFLCLCLLLRNTQERRKDLSHTPKTSHLHTLLFPFLLSRLLFILYFIALILHPINLSLSLSTGSNRIHHRLSAFLLWESPHLWLFWSDELTLLRMLNVATCTCVSVSAPHVNVSTSHLPSHNSWTKHCSKIHSPNNRPLCALAKSYN